MKKINFFIILMLLFLASYLSIVSAEGSFEISPQEVSQNNNITVTIFPGSGGFNNFGQVYGSADNFIKFFRFDCAEGKCDTTKTTEVFIDDSYLGNYYILMFDLETQHFVKKTFTVISGTNLPANGDGTPGDGVPASDGGVPGDEENGGTGGNGDGWGNGGTGGPGGTGNVSEKCIENWKCADWTDCVNGVKLRTCEDENNCKTELKKPREKSGCFLTKNQKNLLFISISIILFVIVIIIIIILLVRVYKNRHKKQISQIS